MSTGSERWQIRAVVLKLGGNLTGSVSDSSTEHFIPPNVSNAYTSGGAKSALGHTGSPVSRRLGYPSPPHEQEHHTPDICRVWGVLCCLHLMYRVPHQSLHAVFERCWLGVALCLTVEAFHSVTLKRRLVYAVTRSGRVPMSVSGDSAS